MSGRVPSPARAQPGADAADGPRVLVLDDDPLTLRFVRDALTEAGFVVTVSGDPEQLPELIRRETPDLVLLDLVLPNADGIELMRGMPELAAMPVIFISAYGRDESIAEALAGGAADYIVKPFSPTELVARAKAALRRRAVPESFTVGALSVHFDRNVATLAGQPLKLTAKEFLVLRALAANAGRPLSVDTLLGRVWRGKKRDASVVRATIKLLRRKLADDARDPVYIVNVRGLGYRMGRPQAP